MLEHTAKLNKKAVLSQRNGAVPRVKSWYLAWAQCKCAEPS